ncbi:hypothetical protein HNV11_18950 [Spirosoma taeanense]|uniref:Uncharacterized protein n=1 Tax=Spirosoma taeanense TaxID=2735870 RepID=A0A6M5YDB0_9BACT|nr:hypothetical protein [Spirosoma taeanense]QJW91306.1 hypothetical protein HNV11_18950 [Spirosoma taeanense]
MTFIRFFLLAASFWLPLNLAAQTRRDSTKATPVRQLNPNDRRNGYETYRSTSEIVGSGPYTMVNTIDHRYEGLVGTPYFLPDWNKGQIEMAAGQNYNEVPIKFDAFRQHLILLRPWAGNDSIIVNPEQVKSFQLKDAAGQTYLFRRIPLAKTDDEYVKEGYFLVLYQGKSALLKRIAKTFKRADFKDPYSNNIRYDSFKETFTYYVLKPDLTLTKVKLTKKSLLDALNDKGDVLKTAAETLIVKTEADAITLVQQYDRL